MRFDRAQRYEDYIWTRRKEVAFLNRHKRVAQKLERDYPLFADQLAPTPETDVDAEKALRIARARKGEQRMRDHDASVWRKGRASYFACDPAMRARIMAEWGVWPGPAKPQYFIYVVEKHNGVGDERTRRMREREAEIRAKVLPMLNSQGDLLGT
ncbi:MAG: hypothetical protein ACN6QT_06025 [Burkholderia contaminans]|uniref:Uncharacterized protein n=1 Tax=Burkholderia aenigmatica TaxID=2015348 RepID=A0A228HPS1_9BURK|nr:MULTISPECIES: hypothetical protein [Burkholderia cepacia complex]KVR79863.1 hypothetical protein WK24_30505 [Burkholderia vietnamiensis]KVS19424.1 hypothetical protein WK32_21480 [Burkholderia vietnamiensis]MBR8009194.1 hypothetical protein [Burkholderia vietnamiensis]MBR8151507.1 hypothetical protein [Burkholderia vietnamiensis]MBR8164639.1 hypothetical protein [Burkholderia vietnamiensis]